MGFFSDLPDHIEEEEVSDTDCNSTSHDISKGKKRLRKDDGNSNSSALRYIDEKPSFSIENIVRSTMNGIKKKKPKLYEKLTSKPVSLMREDKISLSEAEIAKKQSKRERAEEMNQQKLQEDIDKEIFEDAPKPPPGMVFQDMGLSLPVMQAMDTIGHSIPTPIQGMTIPMALQGRDICGCAATGTGKTVAFMLPTIERLVHRPKGELATRVLVMTPTRELAVQVYDVSKALASYTDIKISLAVGGLDIGLQEMELGRKPDIVIATPGRLIAHTYKTKAFTLKDIEILILDEADRMLDENFSEQLKEIVRQCCSTHQTMLFSATMTDQVKELALVSLDRPIRVFVNNNTEVAQNLRQEFVRMRMEEYRLPTLCYLVTQVFKERTMVFVQRKTECHFLHIVFCLLGLKCGELHGDKKQVERLEALDGFKSGDFDFLIVTDVAARGLDIQGVLSVINYRMPSTYKQYVHRVGRTARAGETGCSVSIYHNSGPDFKVHRTIRKHSLTPLHHRTIDKRNIEVLNKKLRKMQDLIESVKKRFSDLQEKDNERNSSKKFKKSYSKKDKNAPESMNWFDKQKLQKDEENEKNHYRKQKGKHTNGKPQFKRKFNPESSHSSNPKSSKKFKKGPSINPKTKFKNNTKNNSKKPFIKNKNNK